MQVQSLGRKDLEEGWVGKISWRRACQPTPVFLPGESHGQRSLVGYSPWDHKELYTTERAYLTILSQNEDWGLSKLGMQTWLL